MKKLMLFLCFLGSFIRAESNFEKFTKMFTPPTELQGAIKAVIEQLKLNRGYDASPFIANEIVSKGLAYVYAPECSSCKRKGICWHKQGISRIVNAYRMQECIKAHHLNLLGVPEKYIFNGKVFCQKIESKDEVTKLTLEHIKQLTKLAEETGYDDYGFLFEGDRVEHLRRNYPGHCFGEMPGRLGRNIIKADNQRLVFIDTESRSYFEDKVKWSEIARDGRIRHYKVLPGVRTYCKAQYVEKLYHMLHDDSGKFMAADDAHTWITQRLDYLLHSDEGLKEQPPLYRNRAFDPKNIDFEKAEKELKNIVNYQGSVSWFDHSCVNTSDADGTFCKKLLEELTAINKKLQEKYGAQARTEMEEPIRVQAAAYWQSF